MRWRQLWLDGAHPSIVRAFTLGGSRCISTSRDDITMRLYSSRTTNCPFATLSLSSCKGLDKRTACTASETRVDDSTRMGMECAGRNRRPLGTCPGPAPPKRVTLPGSLLWSTCCTCTCGASAQPSHSQPRANKFRKQAEKASARDAMHKPEYTCAGTGLHWQCQWHVCSVMTACRFRANVGLRVMWTLMIIPFVLNYHMLRVRPRRLELSMSTMWIWLCNKPNIHAYKHTCHPGDNSLPT